MHANGIRYACDSMRILSTNNLETPDYIKKVDAFFEYAKRDPDMVSRRHTLQSCVHVVIHC